jgi:Heliorhodopsin
MRSIQAAHPAATFPVPTTAARPLRRIGRWRSYLFGERAYLVLSLVAKSALAWRVFAGTLAG